MTRLGAAQEDELAHMDAVEVENMQEIASRWALGKLKEKSVFRENPRWQTKYC